MSDSPDYDSVNCPAPYLTWVDPQTGQPRGVPCSITYAEFVGSAYKAYVIFHLVFSWLTLLGCVVQLLRLFRAYGVKKWWENTQIVLHLRVVLLLFVVCVNVDPIQMSSVFSPEFHMFLRICANLFSITAAATICFVWIRTANELASGDVLSIVRLERVVHYGSALVCLGLYVFFLVSMKTMPLWKYNSIYLIISAVLWMGLGVLNSFYGYHIYKNFAGYTPVNLVKSGEKKKSKPADVLKVQRLFLSGSILSLLITLLRLYGVLTEIKNKYGPRPGDPKEPLSRSAAKYFLKGFLMYVVLFLFSCTILFFFSKIKKKESPVTPKKPLTPKSNRRARTGSMGPSSTRTHGDTATTALATVPNFPQTGHEVKGDRVS
jgi:hypothetical protein